MTPEPFSPAPDDLEEFPDPVERARHDFDEEGDHDADECYECLWQKGAVQNCCRCGECCRRLIIEVCVRDAEREPKIRERGSPIYTDARLTASGEKELEGAAARNESLRHATGEWIFWLDGDDRLDEDNRRKLTEAFAHLNGDNVAYVMKCTCLPDQRTKTTTVVDHVRLFRNDPAIRWKYRVHEQILPAVRQAGGEVRWADVVIYHTGYQDPALRGRKLERDLRLLHLENDEHPDDPFTLFNLGSIYHELEKYAEAIPLLRRSLERSAPSDSIVRKLFALIVQCHRRLSQATEALAACRSGRHYYPEDAELLFLEGLILREQGDREGAETAWLKLIHGREAEHFASVDAGLRGHKARHNLATLYQETGRHAEAEAHWYGVLAEQTAFLPAWLGLGECLLAQGRWKDLEEHCAKMAGGGHGAVEALVLRARGYLARREYWHARRVLVEEAIPQAPKAVWPRQILTHVLLQEGRNWDEAEQALRDLLQLDPQHAEAQRNLAVLLHQREQTVPA